LKKKKEERRNKSCCAERSKKEERSSCADSYRLILKERTKEPKDQPDQPGSSGYPLNQP
jgi:hypothetical protein